MCAKSLLLVFGILLGLSHLSLSQNWATFQQKHIINTPIINCNTIMDNNIYIVGGQCKRVNTFIISSATTVKAICTGVINMNVLSTTRFQLNTCTRTSITPRPCPYSSRTETNYICVKCENQYPVHFAGIGRCP
uniref:Oocytes ribonuclease n=2 Tax=Aquarana catesbeiana TaxID=8400 RepID=RNASO_AQUCT|nr:RecName: Full=Oocytes ribonuclease; AltName: Full=RC-RNase; AltName: Full=Sialic acid-binding lectin; Short=SBL-C; Flags: Precursor [Aquarana catesbeiana]AAD10702.1 ribonuclease precursor [Aquarana catesbeiana]